MERASTVLPEPDSPTTPEGLAPVQGEARRRRRPGPSPRPVRNDGVQVLDLEQRLLERSDVGELELWCAAAARGSQVPLPDVEAAGAAGRRSG